MKNYNAIYEKNKYEECEWDSAKMIYGNDERCARLLYIGDSISGAIRDIAIEQHKEKIIFDGFATSRSVDNPTFIDAVKIFASQQPNRKVVLFNNGLHGFHLEDYDEYGYYYEKVLKQLMEHFNEPMVVVLSTTVAKNDVEQRVITRNKKVAEIAEKYNLPIIDLFSVSNQNRDKISADGIHYNDEGNKLFLAEIMKRLEEIFEDIYERTED